MGAIRDAEALTSCHFRSPILFPRLWCNGKIAVSRVDIEISFRRCRNGGRGAQLGTGRLPASLPHQRLRRWQRGRMRAPFRKPSLILKTVGGSGGTRVLGRTRRRWTKGVDDARYRHGEREREKHDFIKSRGVVVQLGLQQCNCNNSRWFNYHHVTLETDTSTAILEANTWGMTCVNM